MEEAEYLNMAETIPDNWYTSGEAKEISSAIFYDIMIATAMRSDMTITDDGDFQELLGIIAKAKNVPLEEVLQYIKNIALSVGAVKLFNEKYPDMAEKFPKNKDGNPIYPSKFLAKILGVTAEIAKNLNEGVLTEYSLFLNPIPEQ